MCVWNELPGYDPEYTETDRKDIQNLAKELETSYARYELRKDLDYETDDNIPSCWAALCLDWLLHKICCRSQDQGDTVNNEEDVYRKHYEEKF